VLMLPMVDDGVWRLAKNLPYKQGAVGLWQKHDRYSHCCSL